MASNVNVACLDSRMNAVHGLQSYVFDFREPCFVQNAPLRVNVHLFLAMTWRDCKENAQNQSFTLSGQLQSCSWRFICGRHIKEDLSHQPSSQMHCIVFFFIIIFHSSLSHSLVSTSIPNIMSCTPLSLIQLLSAHIMIHTRSDTFRNPQTSEECLKNVWIQCGFKALTDSAMLRTKRPAL